MASRRILQQALAQTIHLATKSTTLPLLRRAGPNLLTTTRPVLTTFNVVTKRQYNSRVEEGLPFKIIDFDDIQSIVKKEGKGYQLIDVREQKEVADGVIPTAKNVPLSQFSSAWSLSDKEFQDKFGFEKPQKDASIILYCLGGVRSTKAAFYLYDLGYDNLQNYVGSWADYIEKVKK